MATISKIQQNFIGEIFLFDLLYSKGKYFKFLLSWRILFEIITFEITIYFVMKWNLLNLAAKMEFMYMSTLHKKA